MLEFVKVPGPHATLEQRVRTVETEQAIIRERLENGQFSFSDLRDSIREEREARERGMKEERIARQTAEQAIMDTVGTLVPKPPSVMRIISIVLAVVGLAGGALWGLSQALSEKQSHSHGAEMMQKHEIRGHKETTDQIRSIRETQIEQKTLLEEQTKKLDRLIDASNDGRRRR